MLQLVWGWPLFCHRLTTSIIQKILQFHVINDNLKNLLWQETDTSLPEIMKIVEMFGLLIFALYRFFYFFIHGILNKKILYKFNLK
jgi:hypothetical protein